MHRSLKEVKKFAKVQLSYEHINIFITNNIISAYEFQTLTIRQVKKLFSYVEIKTLFFQVYIYYPLCRY